MSRCLLVLALASGASSSLVRAEVTELDGAALATLIAEGVPVIDVRREDEWRERGVIAGSHLVTFFDENGRHDVDAWLASLERIVDRDEPFVLLCAGGVRSKRVADLLDTRLGFSAVHNVTDGIEAWRAEGGPIESYSP